MPNRLPLDLRHRSCLTIEIKNIYLYVPDRPPLTTRNAIQLCAENVASELAMAIVSRGADVNFAGACEFTGTCDFAGETTYFLGFSPVN